MSGLVPGLEGDTLLEQMNKLFEPPGNQFFSVFIIYLSCHQATSFFFSFSFQYFIDHATAGNQGVDDVGEAHPYFKRPGKGHNHDCCDSCKEGGALVSPCAFWR